MHTDNEEVNGDRWSPVPITRPLDHVHGNIRTPLGAGSVVAVADGRGGAKEICTGASHLQTAHSRYMLEECHVGRNISGKLQSADG